MPEDFLKKIYKEKAEMLKSKHAYYANLKKNMSPKDIKSYHIFKKAISMRGQINLIAEIKKASPSQGLIREDFDAVKIAKIYVHNNAAAISVLTEENYFLGKIAYLRKVNDEVNVPTLMKDFIIDDHQIYEASFCGASAVLLIVAMLEDSQLKDLMVTAKTLGLDCLVEVHDEKEIERAVKAGADIIGVNNRNLHTLEVDIKNCLRMIPYIPATTIIVAESGLKTPADVKRVYEAGANAVLIGETFMRADDIGAKIKEVMYGSG